MPDHFQIIGFTRREGPRGAGRSTGQSDRDLRAHHRTDRAGEQRWPQERYAEANGGIFRCGIRHDADGRTARLGTDHDGRNRAQAERAPPAGYGEFGERKVGLHGVYKKVDE